MSAPRRSATEIYAGIAGVGLDPRGALRFSALVVDVGAAAVEPVIDGAKELGLVVERILPDPDDATLFFVQLSETRAHDETSFVARSDALDAHAARHDARVADWSVTRPRA